MKYRNIPECAVQRIKDYLNFILYPLTFILALGVFQAMADIQSFNPSTEEEEVIFIPVEKEKNIGRNVDKQVMEKFDLPVDPLVQERIAKLGERVSKVADRKDLVYKFTVIKGEKENNYNAFAIPGGYIYIFDDLVEKLGTDDRIAGVLAHEMGHIEARHPVKRMQGAIGATALSLLTVFSPADGQTKAKANAAIGQLMAAYSRHDERQADELSVKYLKESGINPEGAVEALETLQDLMKKAPRMKYSFYKSHPYLSERIAALRDDVKGHSDFDAYINVSTGPKEDL